MTEVNIIDEAVKRAGDFLSPVFRRGTSLTETRKKNAEHISGTKLNSQICLLDQLSSIYPQDDRESDILMRGKLLRRALGFLTEIHSQLLSCENEGTGHPQYSGDLIRTIYGLLDILVLEGILPYLSPGVGALHRPKTVLGCGTPTTPSSLSFQNREGQLAEVVDGLSKISLEPQGFVVSTLRERILSDVISGTAELAFNPIFQTTTHQQYEHLFESQIESFHTSFLLPCLTFMIHPKTPQWLRPRLSRPLSLLPLRDHGVRLTIEFIASSYPPPTDFEDEKSLKPSQGPYLPLEAVQQTSRLFSSVPSSMSPEQWFSTLAPQLIELLDGNQGRELSVTAGRIIGSGILGKRSLGAPSSIGWRIFAEPVLTSINPDLAGVKRTSTKGHSTKGQDICTPLVSGTSLKTNLARLLVLTTSHPNPGLSKRLLGPLLLPLWGILNSSKSCCAAPFWSDTAFQLLESYIRASSAITTLRILAQNLLWNGSSQWVIAPNGEGGLQLCPLSPQTNPSLNIIEHMAQIDSRARTFVDILSSGFVEQDEIVTLFVELTKKWLFPKSFSSDPQVLEPLSNDPLEILIAAKLVREIMERMQDKLGSKSIHVIEIAKQVIEQYIEGDKDWSRRRQRLQRADYASLEDISNLATGSPSGSYHLSGEDDTVDLLSFAVSLITAVISSLDTRHNPDTIRVLSSLAKPLEYIINSTSPLPASLIHSIKNLRYLITQQTIQSTTTSSISSPNSLDNERAQLAQALEDLSSPIPPIRTSAVQTLATLLITGSPTIDPPSTSLRLIQTTLTDNDSYVHTATISLLNSLAMHSPRTVGPILLDVFLDPTESPDHGLEVRLRIAEVFVRFAESVTAPEFNPLPGSDKIGRINLIHRIAVTSIRLASRRVQRPETLKARLRSARLAKNEQENAKEVWGGDVPLLSPEVEGDSVERQRKEYDAHIVNGWEDTGFEEDIRIRASALGILARTFETGIQQLDPKDVESGLELAITVVQIETDAIRAILRRAAVLVVLAALKGLDAVWERGDADEWDRLTQNAAWKAALESDMWTRMRMVVEWVNHSDEDEMTRGHAEAVLEGFETWRLKRLTGLKLESGAVMIEPRFGLGGQLRGLAVNLHQSDQRRHRKIEEIE